MAEWSRKGFGWLVGLGNGWAGLGWAGGGFGLDWLRMIWVGREMDWMGQLK